MDLTKFDSWLLGRGLSVGTREQYLLHVRMAHEHPKGWRGRLLDKSLAPKTVHAAKAALKALAKFQRDGDTLAELDDLRLPPALRARPKTPLETSDWKKVLKAAGAPSRPGDPPPVVLAVIGIMALRGPRVGDVLRLKREEVRAALRTGVLALEGKGGKRLEYRAPGIEPFLTELVSHKDWSRVEDLVSPGAESRKAGYKRILRWLTVIAEDAGIDGGVPTHRLRRTYAVHYLRAMQGDPEGLEKLRQHMGWSDMDTTAGYVDHVRGRELDDAQDRALSGVLPTKGRSR